MKRKQITDKEIKEAVANFEVALNCKLRQKGHGTFASRHEIQGIVTEEYHELVDALKTDNKYLMRQELLDIAVACVFGLASIDSNKIDW